VIMNKSRIMGLVVIAVVMTMSHSSAQAESKDTARGAVLSQSIAPGKQLKMEKAEGKEKSDKNTKMTKLTRKIDDSLAGCSVYSVGRMAKPSQTYVTRADKARVRAEAEMLLRARRNDSDLVTYYTDVPDGDGAVPQHDMYRISDRNGSKKSCMPSGL
jgi:hypothetical protein